MLLRGVRFHDVGVQNNEREHLNVPKSNQRIRSSLADPEPDGVKIRSFVLPYPLKWCIRVPIQKTNTTLQYIICSNINNDGTSNQERLLKHIDAGGWQAYRTGILNSNSHEKNRQAFLASQ